MDTRTVNDILSMGNGRTEQRNVQGRLSLENNCTGHVEHHCHHHIHQGSILPLLVLAFLLFGDNNRGC